MGRDKATIPLADGTLLGRRAIDALTACGVEDPVAVGGSRDIADVLSARWVPDPDPPVGPVGGLLAAIDDAARAGHRAVVVLACDLPEVRPTDVEALLDAWRPDRAAVVASIDGRAQYPNGVWSTGIAPRLRAAIGRGVHDVGGALQGTDVVLVEVETTFRDADQPGDLPPGVLG
jgi:molybdopterin-guanine dinucleotide biosynthesis protein A